MLNPDKVKLAIAPIGWTNDDMPDLGAENTFEQCISEMALAGFKGSEIGNKYPKDPDVLKNILIFVACKFATLGFRRILLLSLMRKQLRLSKLIAICFISLALR